MIGIENVGKTLHLTITTRCNQRCPDCCNGMSLPNAPKREMTIGQVAYAGKNLGHFKIVAVSGGEPTLHSQFPEVVRAIKENFDTSALVLATNGARLMREENLSVLPLFDRITIMQYDKETFSRSSNPNCGIDNTNLIVEFEPVKPPGVQILHIKGGHIANNRDAAHPCVKLLRTVSVFEDKIYPCCTAAALPSSGFVSISPDWRDKIRYVKIPCIDCPFAAGKSYIEDFEIDTRTMTLKRDDL